MKKRDAWALIALAFVAMVAWLGLIWAYNPGGLLPYTIVLYAIALLLFLNIRRVSMKRKQAVSG